MRVSVSSRFIIYGIKSHCVNFNYYFPFIWKRFFYFFYFHFCPFIFILQ